LTDTARLAPAVEAPAFNPSLRRRQKVSLADYKGRRVIFGNSPTKPGKLAKFRDAEKLTFPLLSDPERKTLAVYVTSGEEKMYGKTVQGVYRD
jgi:peroxiredoxin Q/BCP